MILPILTFLVLACNAPAAENQKDTAAPSDPVFFRPLTTKQKAYYAAAAEPLYKSLLLNKRFNGSILLAKNGEPIFEDYHGFINMKTKEPITSSSTFHLASISKTFTATVVLRLLEQGKLALEDQVTKYIPGFPYANVTIRDLLSHRSGLPKYEVFLENIRTEVTRVRNKKGKWINRTRIVRTPPKISGFATNETVVQYMIANKPAPEGSPNRRFSYCNTNYTLLAFIVEKITAIPFPTYMKDSVFTPLGMTNTYVFSIRDTGNYTPSYHPNNSPYKMDKFDCIYGDKNVYSTVRDLLQWDKSLYQGILVSTETMKLAYTPYSNERPGVKNYGLGWHLLINPREPMVIYHNGWWHGNNTVFKRMVNDTATVIILSNRFNNAIYPANKISSVLTGRADTTALEQ